MAAAPALTPAACRSMPVGEALDLLGGHGRFMESVRRAAEAGAGQDGGREYTRPDGTRVVPIKGIDGLKQFLRTQGQTGQAAAFGK